ncbi:MULTISPECIES: hypothetical protein [Rhizobium]|uniref:hypothetical protein n=1 Tax=Rhizobium TaxID=379 RepID=UPI00161922D2|nr:MULTISPECIES: hypothetical protein [Rhizobium]MBB6305583.1 hypothetical protein [Rhizobium leucaenae]MDK4743623.1 hypothetical protein [Rhizobium sp. CNPSo 3464]
MDLFVTARPMDLSDTQRAKVLTLLQLLLTEAAAELPAELESTPNGRQMMSKITAPKTAVQPG